VNCTSAKGRVRVRIGTQRRQTAAICERTRVLKHNYWGVGGCSSKHWAVTVQTFCICYCARFLWKYMRPVLTTFTDKAQCTTTNRAQMVSRAEGFTSRHSALIDSISLSLSLAATNPLARPRPLHSGHSFLHVTRRTVRFCRAARGSHPAPARGAVCVRLSSRQT